jgi:peptidoglycan/LPS O-acetylase OafA/YrhL
VESAQQPVAVSDPPRPEPAPKASARPEVGGRLRQIDIFRLLICFCVVARHAGVAQYAVQVDANYTDRPVVGALMFAGHFTRNAFFFVSALVLVYAYAPRLDGDGRLADSGSARRRRLKLIGLPYLVWTMLYLVSTQIFGGIAPAVTEGPEKSWARFIVTLPDVVLHSLITGDASYHLYFLVVTLQFTVLFPLFLRLLQRTRRYHGWLLAGSFVLQLITLRCYATFGMPTGTWKAILGDSSLVAYQFFLILGGVVGLNVGRVHDWITEHRLLVLLPLPLATVALLMTYKARLDWADPAEAADAMHPMVLVFAAALLGPLYLAADWLARRRASGVRTVLDRGGQLSFGIYLAHPLVLSLVFLVWLLLGWSGPAAWHGVLAIVLTLAGTIALCLVAHRSRLSLPLIGRPRRKPRTT